MSAYHDPEPVPEPPSDWRNAMLFAIGTVFLLSAVAGICKVAGWIGGMF